MAFEISAAARYQNGKGELLRFRNGLRAGRADTSGIGMAALVAGLVLIGHIHVSHPASVTCALPRDVAETAPEGKEPSIRTIWKIGESTEQVAEKLEQAFKTI